MYLSSEDEELYKRQSERSFIVTKSNELIQNSRFNLSAQSQQILLYIISKIKPNDKKIDTIKFNLVDFCGTCGITAQRKNYDDITKALKELADNSFIIKTTNKIELKRWIDTFSINLKSKTAEVYLSPSLTPFLLALRECFTQYQLSTVLTMKSKYSIRLYELFRSYAYKGGCTISIDNLRKMLCLQDKYQSYSDLKKYVLLIAQREINEYSDINIEFTTKREGRTIAVLYFTITEKTEEEKRQNQLKRDLLLENKEDII